MIPKRLSRRTVYESDWVNLYLDQVAYPDGAVLDSHHVLHFDRPSVGVVVENQSGDILLLRCGRYVTQNESWEIPAGWVEAMECVLSAAGREALEETGYALTSLSPLYTYHPSNGISDQVFHLFRGLAHKKTGLPDPAEVSALRWCSRDEIREMIQKQEISCGLSLTALLLTLCSTPFEA